MNVTDQDRSSTSALKFLLVWGIYPFSWLIVLGAFHFIFNSDFDPRKIWGATIGVLGVTYLIVEILVPYEKRWSMTWRSFIADMKYVILNSAFVSLTSAMLALGAISIAGRSDGFASDWPIPLQLLSALLVFEACHYSIHRYMHTGRGGLGFLFWRIHAAHHLPPRLYLIMHAVGHPINGTIIQACAIVLPIWLVGYSEEAVVMFLIINGMHGLISHFNVDVRMGWVNYIFIGTELHRYHHSANVNEAGNFGATLSIFDQIFGTFIYRPGTPPAELGVDESSGFPSYERVFPVLALPFGRRHR